MRYMLLLYVSDRPQGPDAFRPMMEFHAECRARSVLVASDPLQGPDTATTVRVRKGEKFRTDGPFVETKEWLGGYFILDCRDLDEALELAAMCPTAEDGHVEVRPLLEMG